MPDESLQQEILTRHALADSVEQAWTGEPVLAQRDEQALRNLEERCYEWKPLIVKDPDTNEIKPVTNDGNLLWDKSLKYPSIKGLLSSIGHLEGTSNFNRQQANWIYLVWEETQFLPRVGEYAEDRAALDLLYDIRGWKMRQIYGDSMNGSRQAFIVNVKGFGERVWRMLGKEKGEGGGLFSRLMGR